VVGRAEENDPERALDVHEELVAETHEQRERDRDDHPGEGEDSGEHRPAGARPEQVECGRG
jgi:hypothetical protein